MSDDVPRHAKVEWLAHGLWVAEQDGRILGFAWSGVCGDMWFLAQLFVTPGHQGHRIGNELIKRALEHAEKSNACNRVFITFAFNKVSQGLYMRHGLFPRFPIYGFSVTRGHLVARLERPQLTCSALEDDTAGLRRTSLADLRVLGISREKHHRYLNGDARMRGFNLYDGNDWVGYFYVDAAGHIGPLAVTKPQAVVKAFRTALNRAAGIGSPHPRSCPARARQL